jgi:signal transduction histidine kinase
MRSPTIRSHPLRFLQYLEWILLAIIIFSEVLLASIFQFRWPRPGIFNLIGISVFGIMGLRLPQKSAIARFLYIGGEILLILWTSVFGGVRLFAFLYIIFVSRNCFIVERKGRLFLATLAFVLYGLTQSYRIQTLGIPSRLANSDRWVIFFLSSTLLFGLVLLFLQLLVDAVLSEREGRDKLAIANVKLREYALRIEDIATLQERNRIAREIHDSLGHSLTVFNLNVEAALRLLNSDPQEAKELLIEAKQQGAKALKDVRQSVAALRSDPLEGMTLESAIASLIEDFQRSTTISPQTQISLPRPLAKDVKTAVYRIVQESLTNIYKYAEATEVKITIQTDTDLNLIVEDNGKGFNLEQNTTGFGLQGMRERAQALDSYFKIVTAPGSGCKIMAKIPLP